MNARTSSFCDGRSVNCASLSWSPRLTPPTHALVGCVCCFRSQDSLHPGLQQGTTPLHAAIRHQQPGIVKVLLEKKADPGLECSDGATAAETAIFRGTPSTLRLLLDSKVDPSVARPSDGNSLLMLAAYEGQFQMIRDLLVCGRTPFVCVRARVCLCAYVRARAVSASVRVCVWASFMVLVCVWSLWRCLFERVVAWWSRVSRRVCSTTRLISPTQTELTCHSFNSTNR